MLTVKGRDDMYHLDVMVDGCDLHLKLIGIKMISELMVTGFSDYKFRYEVRVLSMSKGTIKLRDVKVVLNQMEYDDLMAGNLKVIKDKLRDKISKRNYDFVRMKMPDYRYLEGDAWLVLGVVLLIMFSILNLIYG